MMYTTSFLKKGFLLFLFFVSFLCSGWGRGVGSDVDSLLAMFRKAARFEQIYPREKVYVHFDNSAYLMGDTIWYKAYVVSASSLRPTALSRVLYVQLVNADGMQVEKQILKLDSMGTASGAFSLKLPVREGYYEVRAYTREMLNWGAAACFSRVLPVFRERKPSGDGGGVPSLVDLSIPLPDYDRENGYSLKKVKKYRLDFYPEGGLRCRGLEQRMAYKLTDGKGNPMYDTLGIYRSDGTLLMKTAAEHEGMGSFMLPSDFVDGYVQVGNENRERYALPQPTAGYSVSVDAEGQDVKVRLLANDSILSAGNMIGIGVFNRGQACYFDTLIWNEPVELAIPRSSLRAGVNSLEVFDVRHGSLATRLFWLPFESSGSKRKARVTVAQNEVEYAPFSPAVVKMRVEDADGYPISGASLSVSVRDESGNILETHDGGLEASLLLSSELKGYIHRPDLYFSKDDAAHRHMLDLLMQVQGWTANSFDVMVGRKPFKAEQPVEKSLMLRGFVYKENNRKQPLPDVNLLLRAYRYENDSVKGGALSGDLRTDTDGSFAFDLGDTEGDYIAQFTMRKGEKNRKTWSRLALDRWFEPKSRRFMMPELALLPYNGHIDKGRSMDDVPQTFEWQDTIYRAIPSVTREAEVVAKKRKYKGFTGNRYTWGGGEALGMRNSLKYLDVQMAWERLKDSGVYAEVSLMTLINMMEENLYFDFEAEAFESILTQINERASLGESVDDFLQKYDAEHSLETETSLDVKYKGYPITVYVNNEQYGSYVLMSASCSGIKSVAWILDNEREDAVSGENTRHGYKKYVVYIYGLKEEWRLRNGKGKEYRHISGFAPQKKFYAPDYHKFDVPSEKDVRRTLYWNPNMVTDSKGEAHVVLFTNSHDGQTLDISVRGISTNGLLIDWN